MKIFATLLAATALAACRTSPNAPSVGSDHDRHGCIHSAGYSWSSLQQKCVQPWSTADLKLGDHSHTTAAVYVIFAPDQSQAEVFSVSASDGMVLENVKGGYASRDGKIRLMREENRWVLKRAVR